MSALRERLQQLITPSRAAKKAEQRGFENGLQLGTEIGFKSGVFAGENGLASSHTLPDDMTYHVIRGEIDAHNLYPDFSFVPDLPEEPPSIPGPV